LVHQYNEKCTENAQLTEMHECSTREANGLKRKFKNVDRVNSKARDDLVKSSNLKRITAEENYEKLSNKFEVS
jgi:hypothetical protein